MLKLGVVMDPIDSIKTYKDSTFAMLLEAQRRNWGLFYMEMSDLSLQDGAPYANLRELTVSDKQENWFRFGPCQKTSLKDLDLILMRKDPPFDMEYIYATFILQRATDQGTLVINRPDSLRDANEKLFTAWFPEVCAPTLVSRDAAEIKQFLEKYKDLILKPLDGMGGRSIFRVRVQDPNTNVIIETLSDMGRRFIMAQQFIPAISEGDKRILLINGEPIPYALARIPAPGENRGNLAAGATGVGVDLSERDYQICRVVGPKLVEMGLVFVGLDVIGDYLTEINVTSPTCIRELDTIYHLNIAGELFDCIEESYLCTTS